MSRIYKNPPIIEALCEFQFQSVQEWDSTIPGVLWTRLKDEFPVKQEHQVVDYLFDALQPTTPPRVQQINRLQFRRTDNSALIQVGTNTLIVNHLRPYPAWEVFRSLIDDQLRLYRDVAQPVAIAQISLRYINRLELSIHAGIEELEPEAYCYLFPRIPTMLTVDAQGRAFNQQVEVRKPEKNGNLVIIGASVPAETPEHIAFLLDLSFVSFESIQLDGTMAWIEEAHEQIELAFNACFTEKAKEFFN